LLEEPRSRRSLLTADGAAQSPRNPTGIVPSSTMRSISGTSNCVVHRAPVTCVIEAGVKVCCRTKAMTRAAVVVAVVALGAVLRGQETRPVPKDSVRVAIPGCTKGYVFTAGPRKVDEPGNFAIREGMHVRMNGPKKVMAEIKAHEGSAIEITGLMKKGQYNDGVNIGGGVRIAPGPSGSGGFSSSPASNQIQIDVEAWRPIDGVCRSR
jgi:hypothetical protein